MVGSGVSVGRPSTEEVKEGLTENVKEGSTDGVEDGLTDKVEDGSTEVGRGSGLALERVTLLPSKLASLRERSERPPSIV